MRGDITGDGTSETRTSGTAWERLDAAIETQTRLLAIEDEFQKHLAAILIHRDQAIARVRAATDRSADRRYTADGGS